MNPVKKQLRSDEIQDASKEEDMEKMNEETKDFDTEDTLTKNSEDISKYNLDDNRKKEVNSNLNHIEQTDVSASGDNRSSSSLLNIEGTTIKERFLVPQGYERVKTDEGTFMHYLQNLPLKPHGSKVKYYDGREKLKDVYLAVVDYSLGDRDLQQCADGVMRLRAEYLYSMERFDEIHFNFVSGFKAEFSKWAQGKGILVEGNQVTWTNNSRNNNSYESFQKYLDIVYAYASTLSLEKELIKKELKDISIGDVFIQGGSPGHCVIVVDMAKKEDSDEVIFMLAQSYMPAQDIQILIGDEIDSPWFSASIDENLITPEWTFRIGDLKTWE